LSAADQSVDWLWRVSSEDVVLFLHTAVDAWVLIALVEKASLYPFLVLQEDPPSFVSQRSPEKTLA
jgi:hypothetical protein